MNKRINWLDIVKGFSIIGVVMGHSITQGMAVHENIHSSILLPLSYLLFLFVMPAFFSVSGYLYEREYVNSFKSFCLLLYKKISSFLLPYLLFMFIGFLIEQYKKSHFLFIFHLQKFVYDLLTGPSYVWFLYALFLIFIISGIMDLFSLGMRYQFIIYLLLLLVQFHFKLNVGEPNLSGVISYGIFFWLGEFIFKYENYINKYIDYIVIFFMISLSLLIYYLLFISKSGMDMNNVSLPDIAPKLLSIPILFKSCQLVDKSNRANKHVIKWGRYTLIIYLVHFYLVKLIGDIIDSDIRMLVVQFIIIFMFSWLVSILVCKLSNEYKIINILFYTRKYITKLIIKTKWGKWLLLP